MFRRLYVSHLGALAIIFLFAALIWSGAHAQDKAKPPSDGRSPDARPLVAEELSIEKLKAKRAEVEGSTALSDTVKKSTLTFLDQAIRFREHLNQINKDAEDFAQRIKGAPDRIKKLEAELKRLAAPPDPTKAIADLKDMDAKKLDQRLRQQEAELVEAKGNLTKLAEQLEKEKTGPERLTASISKGKQRLKEVEKKLDAAPPSQEPATVTEARRASLLTERAKYQAEIGADEQHLGGHDLFMSLLKAERDFADLKVKKGEELTKVWKEEAQKRREREALKAVVGAEEAKYEASKLPEPVQKEFEINVWLAEELDKMIREQAFVTKELERKKAQLKTLEQEFALARERVKIRIRSEAIGLALREQRRSLPSFLNYRQESNERQVKMSKIRSTQIELEHVRAARE